MSTVTPLTDAESARLYGGKFNMLEIAQALEDHAQQLEVQLAAKEQELAEARAVIIAFLKRMGHGGVAFDQIALPEIAEILESIARSYVRWMTWKEESDKQLTARDATIEGLRKALEAAKVGIADQWKRDVVVGTPLRDASIAVDAALAQLPPLPSAVPDSSELPGMWEKSDLIGGETDCAVPVHPDTARLDAIAPSEITKLREAENLTQAEFGKLVGVRQATVSEWECGKSKPSRLAIMSIRLLDTKAECSKWRERANAEADKYGELLRALGTFNHREALAMADAARQSTGEQGT